VTTLSDEQLMSSLVKEGQLAAFEELLRRYEKSLFNYILKHIGDFHKAQDLFQETFYRIFKNRHSFNPDLRFSTWLYRITTNLCIDELRKKTHEMEVFLEDTLQAQVSDGHAQDKTINKNTSPASPEERLLKKDLEATIKELVKSLPEKLKSVFILSEYQGLPRQEIAEILEIPVGTVKSRLHHSFKQLVELMEKRGLINELQ